MSRSRGTASLRWPPEDLSALEGFPVRRFSPATELFRVVLRGRGPWWFGSSMQGRFDLAKPEGTCYLATNEISALLEVVGPDLEGGFISSDLLKARSLRKVRLPRELDLADLTSREAIRFGITAEIGTIVPYACPQAWAARLRATGSAGVAYWPRHDPARKSALALFGPHGERTRWRRGRAIAISREMIELLYEECGIEVIDVPRSDELILLSD